MRPEAVSQLAGAYHGARPGVGLTFAELRAYEPGDDVRHLDWNVTARQGKPFVRRFVEERSLTLWLVLDVSASMRFGPEGRTKADRAAQAAALLATAAAHNGDRVGLLMVSDRIEVELEPAGGIRHLSQIVRALVATPTTSLKTQLGVGLARVRRSARRAMIVVLSDFGSEEPIGLWRRAARRHDAIALRIVQPAGGEPARGRPALAGGRGVRQDARDRRLLETAAGRLRLEGRGAQAGLPSLVRQRRRGWLHHVHRGGADPLPDRALLPTLGAEGCPLTQESPGVLVPPRPNPGPEPWPRSRRAWRLPLASASWRLSPPAGVPCGAPPAPRPQAPGNPAAMASPWTPDDSPAAQLLASAGQGPRDARDPIRPLDPARTTEELSTDRAVQEALGDDQFESLIRLLSTADHWKFASPPENGQTESPARGTAAVVGLGAGIP